MTHNDAVVRFVHYFWQKYCSISCSPAVTVMTRNVLILLYKDSNKDLQHQHKLC